MKANKEVIIMEWSNFKHEMCMSEILDKFKSENVQSIWKKLTLKDYKLYPKVLKYWDT